MQSTLKNRTAAWTAGLAGAAALTGIHQLARRITADAPRMDVLGERAIVRGIRAAGGTPPGEPALSRWALAGDLLSNSAYYSIVASGDRAAMWTRGVTLGLAAGAGALVLPQRIGLGDAPRSDRAANQLMTLAWYLAGGLVAAAVGRRLRAAPD
jgi:hypothetical protein